MPLLFKGIVVNRTVKQTLYQLRRQFGVKLTLYTRTVGDVVNDFTGEQTVGVTPQVIRAILLPLNSTVQERLDRGASSRYSGDVHVGDRELIITDKYTISVGDYLEYGGKHYDVISLADYETGAYFVLIRNTQNESTV
jgi:hypothetical protein